MPAPVTRYPAAEAQRIGFRLHLRGDYPAAAEVFGAAQLEDATPAELARFYAAAASTSWAQGDIDGCRSGVALAYAYADRSQDDEALGWAWAAKALLAALDGDPHAEGHAFSRASRHAARAGDVTTQTRIFNNLGNRLTTRGHHEQAIAQLEKAFAMLDRNSDPALAALIDPVIRENLGRALLGLGRCVEARELFEQARRRWLEAGAPQVARALLGLGDTNLALGNASRAASAYREVIQLSDGSSALHELVPALAGLARATVVDDPDECDRALDRALDLPSRVAPVVVHLAAGWVALARGLRHVAISHAREAEREAGRQEAATGLADALELLSLAVNPDRPDGRLSEARMIWIENQDAVRSMTNEVIMARRSGDLGAERRARAGLQSLGVRDDTDRIAGPLLILGTAPRARVEVHTLGTFSVTRDGRRVSAVEWPSAQARTLLQVLAACLGRGISRAELTRRLWPNGDVPEDGLSRVISELRGVLDPLREHTPDDLVHVDADVVTLDPQEVSVDAAVFLGAARFALAASEQGSPRAAELLASAAALHTGRFLDDRDEEDWVLTTRSELFRLSRAVRHALAREHADQPEIAIPWLIGLVHDEPYDGVAQLELIRAFGAAGRTSEASRYYAEYVDRMREAGRVPEPMPF